MDNVLYESEDDVGEYDEIEDEDEVEVENEDEDEIEEDDGETLVVEKTSDDRIIRDGDDRVTPAIINRFEFCNAVKHVIGQINKGAKVPQILNGTKYMECVDTKLLAWYSVFFTVRHSKDEKPHIDTKKCASVIIMRPVGSKYIEKWRLWELAYLENFPKNYDLNLEYVEKFLVDSSEITPPSTTNVTL